MKRPGFRLERVLRVRKILEEEARADWAEAEDGSTSRPQAKAQSRAVRPAIDRSECDT